MMRQKTIRIAAIATLIVSLLLTLLIATDWWPYLRGPQPDSEVWHWTYAPKGLANAQIFLGSLIAGLLLSVYWLETAVSRRRTRLILLLLAAVTFFLQFGLVKVTRQNAAAELIDRTLAVDTSGYFWTAAQLPDLSAALTQYPELMPTFESDHAQTHPPGLVVLNRWTINLLERAPRLANRLAAQVWPQRCTDRWLLDQSAAGAAALGIWSFLPLVLWAAAVPLTYPLAIWVHPQSLTAAKMATIMTAFLPAAVFFVPVDSQIFAALTVVITLLFWRGISTLRLDWLVAAGLLLSFSSFLSIGNAPLLLPLIALGFWLRRDDHWRDHWRWLLPFGVGSAAVWLIYWVWFGVPPWEIALTGLDNHYALATSQRSYGRWLGFNLVDLLLFAGLPAVLGTLGWLWAIRQQRSTAAVMSVIVLGFIILLNLSGSTRGEVGRIWLLFMPWLTILGGLFWGSFSDPNTTGTRPSILLAQLILLAALGLSWQGIEAVIVQAEQPPMPAIDTGTLNRYGLEFGEQIALTHGGARFESAAWLVKVDLVWEAVGPVVRPYTVFNHVRNAEGDIVTQLDGWPVDNQWPPTCWQVGEQVVDRYTIVLSETLPPGRYELWSGLYDPRDFSRLTTQEGSDAVLIGSFGVPSLP
ncbi:MAG: hypothetical protein QNJ45_13355 [Ardenticatenaceae bacterium]|nr:hypothetical protein [Ardenticatenaceae bacterium]